MLFFVLFFFFFPFSLQSINIDRCVRENLNSCTANHCIIPNCQDRIAFPHLWSYNTSKLSDQHHQNMFHQNKTFPLCDPNLLVNVFAPLPVTISSCKQSFDKHSALAHSLNMTCTVCNGLNDAFSCSVAM